MIDYSRYDGIALSDLLRKKEIRIPELLESVISNIERLNPSLNAVVYKFYDRAMDTARRLEDGIVSGSLEPGPFYGVPFLIKNLTADYNGEPFSDSSRFVEGHVSDVDAEIIRRYEDAGLIICGRTNASEFGLQPTTEPLLYGPTRNPWNTAFTPGGSSGGSAAAVASGLVPAAHGNDGGGSLRIPGSCCGLFALKPSRGRNPLGPLFGDFASGIVCEHVLTRSVRDSAALLDITRGPAPGDPYFSPHFDGSYLEESLKAPRSLRIALLTDVPEGWSAESRAHPDCRAAAEDAAMLCEELGHHVEPVSPAELAWPSLADMFIRVFLCFVNHGLLYWQNKLGKKVREEDLEPATWNFYQAGLEIPGGEYLSAIESLQLFTRKSALWFDDGGWDLLLSPTMRIPPTELGAFDPAPEDPDRWIENAVSFVTFTRIQNITGQPAMSVPLYWNREGLPIGVQFAARAGAEDLLFRLASQLEKARPWKDRRPPVKV